jgi:plastocyanin domain-containing protein
MRTMIFAGLAAVASIAWVAGCQQSAPAGPQTVKVAVTDAGFVPAQVKVRSGQPVVFLVTRTTDETCAKEIVIADAHIRQDLPLNQEVRIAFTPEKQGEIRYACGMDMIAGTMRVE